MRKIICFAMLLTVLACCLLVASCTTEEVDHAHEYHERILDTDGVPCEGPSCKIGRAHV